MSATEKTPARILMDWMEANNVRLYGATPAMLVTVLESQAGYGKLADARSPGLGYGIPYDPAPRASYPADDYECCASGSCEVCNPGAHRWNS